MPFFKSIYYTNIYYYFPLDFRPHLYSFILCVWLNMVNVGGMSQCVRPLLAVHIRQLLC